MSLLSPVDQKIEIQGHGIKISPELKYQLALEGFYPVALTWLGDDITGPFSFTGYGDNSPFELRKEDGGYHVYRDGKYFAEVSFYKRPRFWDKQWSVGDHTAGTFFVDEGMSGIITPCAPGSLDDVRNGVKIEENDDVLAVTGGKFPFVSLACYNGLVLWPSYGCLYTKQGNPCRFCCIPGDYDENRNLIGQDGWLEGLADAFRDTVEEIGAEAEKISLTVDSGTLGGRDKGAWAYIKTLTAAKSKLPGKKLPNFLYVRAVIEPPYDEESLFQLRDAGFNELQSDIDIYDDDERADIMPNAKGKRPIADYIKVLTRAKEIFPGEIATQLVAGSQSDENLLKGVERFASVGIPTLVTPFLPFGQGLNLVREGKASVPTPDRMRGIYEKAANILVKYGLDSPKFRGGVSSLAETMGRRLKRADVLTNFDPTPVE
ncbi:MAG: hypothetical protein LBR44_01065, partial [Clostridiales Family XIII bacterium]|nr:hypothetical protein [Clostridiales Family XIII bacterium]